MSDRNEEKVLFITGAGRGMGTDIAKAALAAGYKTVATGRNIEKVTEAVGASDNLLVVRLDVTEPGDAQAAVKATVEKFGRIDVLVNNAGNFYAGFFEEITPEDFRAHWRSRKARGRVDAAYCQGRSAVPLARGCGRRPDIREKGS